MSSQQLPSVELVQGTQPSQLPQGRGRGQRWKIFIAVFLVSALIGAAFVYLRAPVYRANASVLTVKPKSVDTLSAAADVEHVAIQRRLLLGEDVLGRLSAQLNGLDGGSSDIEQLRALLSIEAVPETNLLELRAEGGEPDVLQRIVNIWAELYKVVRAEETEAATGRTTRELEEQQEKLALKISAAREHLQRFREEHDIVSLEREENRSLAALKGLNNSLSKARERLVEAQARLAAVDDAIARGETVVPSEQKGEIARMQSTLQKARAQLANLKQQYTQRYLDRDPVLKSLPGELRAMESELGQALSIARITVRDEAQQEVEAARATVRALENNLNDQQARVQQFTERFKEFTALEADLARLGELQAENQTRLTQIQIRNQKTYPPIKIVEWARLPNAPIYPNYDRDIMIALGIALGLALFITWLFEYLSEQQSDKQTAPYIGVKVYPGDQSQAVLANATGASTLPHQQATERIAAPPADLPVLPRELTSQEVNALLAACDPRTRAYASILMSGVSPYELPLLHGGCFSPTTQQVNVPGASQREFRLSESLWPRLSAALVDMDAPNHGLQLPDLDKKLGAAARSAALADPDGITGLSLWHSYLLYLVRQGIDLNELSARVGAIPPQMQDALAHFTPPGGTRPLERIDFTYPALLS